MEVFLMEDSIHVDVRRHSVLEKTLRKFFHTECKRRCVIWDQIHNRSIHLHVTNFNKRVLINAILAYNLLFICSEMCLWIVRRNTATPSEIEKSFHLCLQSSCRTSHNDSSFRELWETTGEFKKLKIFVASIR